MNVNQDARAARQTELLVGRFCQGGVTVTDAVPAFAGMYPTFNGFGDWELLFTRWRVLALAAGDVQVWSAWTGPTPRKLLASADRQAVSVKRGRRRYSRVIVACHRLWVHRRDLASVERWRDAAA